MKKSVLKRKKKLAQKNTQKNPLPTLPFLLPRLCSKQLREWPSPVFLHPVAFSLRFLSSVIFYYSIRHSTCSSTDLCNLRLAVGGISRQGFFVLMCCSYSSWFFAGATFRELLVNKQNSCIYLSSRNMLISRFWKAVEKYFTSQAILISKMFLE